MHIAYYAPQWPPEGAANGIVTYVAQMRDFLLESGHEVTIFTQEKVITSDDSVIDFASQLSLFTKFRGRVSDKIWPGVAAYAGFALAQRLARALEHIDVDVVEIEESFGWAEIVRRALHVPVIMRLHGPHYLGMTVSDDPVEVQRNTNRIEFERAAIERAFAISSPSAELLDDVVSRYRLAARLVEAVPNPISVTADAPWALESCDRSLVLMVGRLDRRKGFDVAVRAFSHFARLHRDARLVVVGPLGQDGIMSSNSLSSKDLIRLGAACDVTDRIDLAGLISPSEITALRRKAFVTIMCSRFENFPYSAAEAMALGCPFISTKSFHAEMIDAGVSGLIVDQEDHLDMARQMDWMFTHSLEAAAIGAAARERVKYSYSSKVVGTKMIDFYERVMHNFDHI